MARPRERGEKREYRFPVLYSLQHTGPPFLSSLARKVGFLLKVLLSSPTVKVLQCRLPGESLGDKRKKLLDTHWC